MVKKVPLKRISYLDLINDYNFRNCEENLLALNIDKWLKFKLPINYIPIR